MQVMTSRHARVPYFIAVALLLAAPVAAQEEETASAVAAVAGPVRDALLLESAPRPSLAQQETPPPVAHTGLETLAKDILSDFKAFPQRKSTWVILALGGAAALAVHPADNSINSHLVSNGTADNVWKPGHILGGPVMYGVPVALYFGGRYLLPQAKGDSQTNKWSHLGLDLLRAELEEEAIVQTLKFTVRRTRPNGTPYSFPSGHSAATFALAAVVERHLGYRLALPTLAIAAYVATSRLHDNVHYASDVLFGAAIGTATGWTVVGRHGRQSYAFAPMPVPGGMALMMSRNTPPRG
jgi:membrane-associated phospholipid phosphatase